MRHELWYPYAPDQAFGRRGAVDQVRLDNFLTAVGQMDVPVTMAAALEAATAVREDNIRREGRAAR
jgi:hypothetical protein